MVFNIYFHIMRHVIPLFNFFRGHPLKPCVDKFCDIVLRKGDSEKLLSKLFLIGNRCEISVLILIPEILFPKNLFERIKITFYKNAFKIYLIE